MVLCVLYPLGRLVFGSGVGEPCRSRGDCRAFWDAHCMQAGTGRAAFSYCTRTCTAARDCPEGWTCDAAIEMNDHAAGGDLSMCTAPESAPERPPAPDPVSKQVRALFDGGSDFERGERRRQLSALALRLAQRARDLHAPDLARACYAIDVARFDCREVEHELGEAHTAVARLEAAQRAQLEDAMAALDSATTKLCAGAE